MRSRNHRIVFYLNDKEYNDLITNVSKSKHSREEYIRLSLNGKTLKEAPPVDYFQMLSKISRESANLNQLLIIARTKRFIDTPRLENLIDEMHSTNDMLWKTFAVD